MSDDTSTPRQRASSETETRRESTGDASELHDTTGPDVDGSFSRRSFLAASAAAAGGLALGTGAAAGQSAVEESCLGEYETIDVANGFQLMNNKWGMPDADQCIWLNDDGSYGYDFSATSGGINYPEVFLGTRPWGDDTGVAEFPINRGDVDELTLEWDVDVNISGGEWDLAEEWWLLDGQPGEDPPLTHEIMLVLDWGGGHSHAMVEENVWTDQFGNQIDYWANYSEGGTSADFHIFRINGGASSGRVDMTEIIDFMSERHGTSENLTLTGIELGNEYWAGAQGDVTYNTFNVTVNGSTYTSGSDGGGGGGWDGGNDGSDGGDGDWDDGSDTNDGTDDGSDDNWDDGSDDTSSGEAVATIDPDTTSPDVGEYVSFHLEDTSGPGQWLTDLEWDLGNGATDSGWHGGTSYDAAGEYTAELTATASDGTTTTDAVTMTVGGGGDGGSGGDDGGDTDDGTDDGSDGTDDSDNWDDGGSDDSSGGTDDGGDAEPHVAIDPSATSVSAGDTVYFATDTNTSWVTDLQWDMDDGTSESNDWHVAHTFDSAGSYTVTLEAESGHNGSRTTDAVTIDVN